MKSWWPLSVYAAVFVLFASVVLAASGSFTKEDGGKEVQVGCGEVFVIELPEKAGTGYTWELDDPRKDIFEVLTVTVMSKAPKGMVGGPLAKSWEIRAKREGTAELTAAYYRPWEGKQKAADRFTITVKVGACVKKK